VCAVRRFVRAGIVPRGEPDVQPAEFLGSGVVAQVNIPAAMREFLRLSESAEKLSGIASQLFFTAFAVASVMLLLSILLPRPRDVGLIIPGGVQGLFHRMAGLRIYLSTAGLIVLLMLAVLTRQLNIDERRGFIADQERRYDAQMKKLVHTAGAQEALKAQYLYMPEGNALKYMTLGNTGIAADYLWLTSLQYVSSSFRRGQKFEMLLRFYSSMQDLDPHWIEAISNAGKVLSALERDRLRVEKFYIRACVDNPSSWQLRYEAGRMFVVPPLDLNLQKEYSKRALDWFNDAVRLLKREPETRSTLQTIKSIEDIAGRMALESDYYEAAEEMLYRQATDASSSMMLRTAAAQDWLSARSMVMVTRMQKRVDSFVAKYKIVPPDLEFMFLTRRDPILGTMLRADPSIHDTDAYGLEFAYDPATGKVSSLGIKARQSLQAAAIVNSLIGNFRSTNKRLPYNLNELQLFTSQIYSNPSNPPTANITDAIGRDLNVVTSPLGTPWDYDQIFGRVRVPPHLSAENLFQNAEKLLNK
jgi:hypothetical protein